MITRVPTSYANKRVFTTGQAAEVCQLSQQTIIRCFDSGRLKGYRVPGSRFRRIPRVELMKFMKANGIPLDLLGEGKRRVLIVDEDERIVALLVDVLKRDGRYDVKTARGGFEAGVLTQRFGPEIVLLDISLEHIDPAAICRAIRNDPALAHIRVILTGAVSTQEQVHDLLVAGADEFVKKPFNIDRLIERIGELLE
ncbi:MAG: response regulator [Phycisphaera sp.]|nr:response regulator [Phycisphaera sp.]